MKFNKPKFWDKKLGFISTLLLPLTLITLLIIFLRKKLIEVKSFDIPIICVGNLYLGGTGKTPTSILIAKELLKQRKKPVILRKFYDSHKDEHELIKKNFKHFLLNKDRVEGVFEALKKKFDTVILDDGFQDYKLKKKLNILCFNENQLIGNGLVIPAGPLRENLNVIKGVDIILINGKKNIEFERKVLNINKEVNIFYSTYKPINKRQFLGKKLFAITGIGNPENFFRLLSENNLQVKKKFIYPDHYEFTKKEILDIINEAKKNNCEIIMTEKDFFKVKRFKYKYLKFLKVNLEIKDKKRLLKIISNIYD